jgi:hypothetical protein
MRVSFFLITSLFISSLSFAEMCPSVESIHHNNIPGWRLYDSDDNQALSLKREVEFKKDVQAFAMADWSDATKQTGRIRCFYHDASGSNLEAYLSKNHFSLAKANEYWYDVSGAKECAAGVEKCGFQIANFGNTQIARGTLRDHLQGLLQGWGYYKD